MKELTIEEKAKRYDEAIEIARKFATDLPNGRNDRLYHVWDLESIFPELKEPEDERIRKELINYFLPVDARDLKKQEWIAWLEKQGEQKPAECDILSAKKGDMLSNGTIVLIVDSIEEFEGKPIINSWYFADSEKFYGKGTSECDRWAVDGFRTATKVECSFLLKMMADAGYEWDAEKKELKIIIDEKQIKKNLQDNSFRRMFEQKQVIDYPDNLPKDNWELIHEFVNKFGRIPKDEDELNVLIEYVLKRQKPAWIQEDENTLNAILNCYKSMDIKWRTWLKSLKHRNTWKPSDE